MVARLGSGRMRRAEMCRQKRPRGTTPSAASVSPKENLCSRRPRGHVAEEHVRCFNNDCQCNLPCAAVQDVKTIFKPPRKPLMRVARMLHSLHLTLLHHGALSQYSSVSWDHQREMHRFTAPCIASKAVIDALPQALHQLDELIAAIFVIDKLVVARTGRRQQYRIARSRLTPTPGERVLQMLNDVEGKVPVRGR